MHLRRRSHRQSIGGDQRREARKTGGPPGGVTAPLGLKIPHGAIDGVAGRARWHQALQRHPVCAGLDRATLRLNRRNDVLNALAIARIGHTFPAPNMSAVAQNGGDHMRFGLGAARNDKTACDRERVAYNL